jgi:hypothetical protein
MVERYLARSLLRRVNKPSVLLSIFSIYEKQNAKL